uniref:Apple domain-containing protein n=1 Tax=Setaria digitata TaxID=48799 RepID=A0A915PCQ4_9BILA
MCIRKFYTIRNSSFFQRIELPSAAQCAERCIDSIEHCKAALFAFDRNKSRGFCQLYNTNSNLSEIDISLDNNLNSISVVFEILDKCPATNDLASSGNDLMAEIKWELKKKLELWSDQEQPLLPITQDATVQHFKKNESTKWITINESLDKRNLRKENLLGKFGQREYHRRANYGRQEMAEQRFNRPDSSPLAGGPVPLIEDVSSSSFSSYDGRLLPQISHSSSSSFNFKENYLSKQDHHKSIPDNTDSFQDYLRDSHSLLTNGIPLPPPIKPVFVKHGQQEAPYDGRCREANCYAPSLAYLQQSGYNWPCSVYTDLCMPKKPHPCFTICQPVTTIQSSMPTTTAANHRFGGDIDGGNMEILKSQDLSSGPTLSSSRTEQLIPSWSEWSPGSPCEPVKEELCSNGPCPEWGPWSAWTECSQSCNGGKQSRSRTCSAGLRCDGPTVSIQACNVEKCAQWSAWSSWESCSVTCGSGQSIRRSSFKEKLKILGNVWARMGHYYVSVSQPRQGHAINRPVLFGQAGTLGYRTRICYSGDNCIGNAEEHEICMRDSCPEWTDWSPWTQCTETCGTTGNKLRTRTCLKDNLVSAYCDGAAQDQITCKHLPECPSWTQWGHWSSCSVTCGHGQENRQRSCLPADMKCVGPEMEFRFCQDSVCPYWDEWSSWSGCSVTCGSGIQERRRKCEILAKAINRENFFPAFPAG